MNRLLLALFIAITLLAPVHAFVLTGTAESDGSVKKVLISASPSTFGGMITDSLGTEGFISDGESSFLRIYGQLPLRFLDLESDFKLAPESFLYFAPLYYQELVASAPQLRSQQQGRFLISIPPTRVDLLGRQFANRAGELIVEDGRVIESQEELVAEDGTTLLVVEIKYSGHAGVGDVMLPMAYDVTLKRPDLTWTLNVSDRFRLRFEPLTSGVEYDFAAFENSFSSQGARLVYQAGEAPIGNSNQRSAPTALTLRRYSQVAVIVLGIFAIGFAAYILLLRRRPN